MQIQILGYGTVATSGSYAVDGVRLVPGSGRVASSRARTHVCMGYVSSV